MVDYEEIESEAVEKAKQWFQGEDLTKVQVIIRLVLNLVSDDLCELSPF